MSVEATKVPGTAALLSLVVLSPSLVAWLFAVLMVFSSESAFAEADRPFFVKWINTENNIRYLSVHFADAHTGWAVGDGGMILATRDGGSDWEPQKSGTVKALAGVYFADAMPFICFLVRLVEANESYARPGNGRRRPQKAPQTSEGRGR